MKLEYFFWSKVSSPLAPCAMMEKSTLVMFENCSCLLSIDLSNFTPRNVTNISYMFYNCVNLSKINLAYAVQDGQKIYVPCIDDEDKVNTIENEAGENIVQENEKDTKSNKVNINTATQTELETLNGIGTSTALKIINYRNENGKFKKVEDIKNVPGIGESKFENIKDSISVK